MVASFFKHVSARLGLLAALLFIGSFSYGLGPVGGVEGEENQFSSSAGATIYAEHCAACHENSKLTKAPPREILAKKTEAQISAALAWGVMRAQGGKLTASERELVGSYLSQTDSADHSWVEKMQCAKVNLSNQMDAATVATFGFDINNSRYLSYSQAGLKPEDFVNLELAWAMAFPETISMRSQPVVVGSTLFLPVGESKKRFFAIDVSKPMSPCLKWVYEGDKSLRSSAAYGELPDGRAAVMVGDFGGYVHVVDASDGSLIWKVHAGIYERSIITGTPILVGDRIYVPSSQYEPLYVVSDDYLCCKFHGGVVALDAQTGERVWEGHTLPEAKPIKDRGDGQFHWGPAGAGVWTSPSVDLKRNQLYVGTTEANSIIAHPNTDAVIAFNLDDGSINWSFQGTANDIYNPGCGKDGSGGKNCTANTVYRDVDFGASIIIASAPNGGELLLAGQKSGTVWALDPDSGEVIWQTDIGTGGVLGGIHWSMATDKTHVYVPINAIGKSIPGQDVPEDFKPGIYALDLNSGNIDWAFKREPVCERNYETGEAGCGIENEVGMSGAITVIGGFVIGGGLDGRVFVLNKKDGQVVWEYNTFRSYQAINGLEGQGGAIDNASIVAANGLLFVNSGYGTFGLLPGNVMLAFKPGVQDR